MVTDAVQCGLADSFFKLRLKRSRINLLSLLKRQ